MIPIVRISLKLSKERIFDRQIKLTVTNLPVLRSIQKVEFDGLFEFTIAVFSLMDCWGENFELSSGAGEDETLMCAGAGSEIFFPSTTGNGGSTLGKISRVLSLPMLNCEIGRAHV